MFLVLCAAIGLAVAGAGAWIAVLVMSGQTPELKSVIGSMIVGPIGGAWLGFRIRENRRTIAARVEESKQAASEV